MAPSPWEGDFTPNINGEERFLRGGNDDVQLFTEEDSLQAHTHEVLDAGHKHSYTDRYPEFNLGFLTTSVVPAFTLLWDPAKIHWKETTTVKSNIEVKETRGARTSHETRPKNIRVVYIMKVF